MTTTLELLTIFLEKVIIGSHNFVDVQAGRILRGKKTSPATPELNLELYTSVYPDGRHEDSERVITCPRGTPSHPCSAREYINLNVERLESINTKPGIKDGSKHRTGFKWFKPFKKRDQKSQKHSKRKPIILVNDQESEDIDSQSETSNDDDVSESLEPSRAHSRVPLRVSDEQGRFQDEVALRAKRKELIERAARERAVLVRHNFLRRERKAHPRHMQMENRRGSPPQEHVQGLSRVEGRSERSYLPKLPPVFPIPVLPSTKKQSLEMKPAPRRRTSQNMEKNESHQTSSEKWQGNLLKMPWTSSHVEHEEPQQAENKAPTSWETKNGNESEYNEEAAESATIFDPDITSSRSMTPPPKDTHRWTSSTSTFQESRVRHRSAKEAASGISPPDSIFSSNAASFSQVAFGETRTAFEYILGLLYEDSQLQTLIDKASTTCYESRFNRLLAHMLKGYASNLMIGASSQIERDASTLIQLRAEHLASHIVATAFSKVDFSIHLRLGGLASLKKDLLERFLDQRSSDDPNDRPARTDAESEAPEPDEDATRWPNLEKLQHFLTGGPAFHMFKLKLAKSVALETFLSPKKDEHVEPPLKGAIEENDTALGITSETQDRMNHSVEADRSDNIPSSDSLPFIGYSYKRFDFHSAAEPTEVDGWKPMETQSAQDPPHPIGVADETAPKTATPDTRVDPTTLERLTSTFNWMTGLNARFCGNANKKKIRWTCECGEIMTWSVPNLSDQEAKMMTAYLDRANSNTSSSSSSRNSDSSSLPSNTSNTSTEATSLPSNGDYHPDGDVSIAVPQSHDQSAVGRRIKPQFLELCVNTGPYCKELGEISLTNIKSDGELFQDIATIYRKIRAERGMFKLGLPAFWKNRSEESYTSNALFDVLSVALMKMIPNGLQRRLKSIEYTCSFMKPSSIIFRKFIIDQDSSIGVFDPELPPPCELTSQRYDYNPHPLRPCEVMPSHLFFHYFHNPTPHYNSKWLPRFPKKLNSSIHSNTDQLPVGWGIHIVESCNYHVVALALFVGLLVSGVLAVVWAMVKEDVQGGFSIGTYVVALQTTWMTTMFFKWKDY